MDIPQAVRGFGPADALDIAIVSLLIYFTWTWFKRTKAAFVAIGMFILAGVYILARILDLVLTSYILQGFFAVILIALVVIFQEELRHFFERIAVWSLGGRRPSVPHVLETDAIVQTLGELAAERNGALIVLRGRDPIERHITEGFLLDGKISVALLKSIFDPHSEGHDGAVVIAENRAQRFGVYLPLGKDLAQNAKLGTRHAAALGLSELTDALCLVVSEERGKISAARNGELSEIAEVEALRLLVERFQDEKGPAAAVETSFWRTNLKEKAAAAALGLGLWFHFVYGSRPAARELDIPVVLHNLPAGMRLSDMEPRTVHATLAGLQRRLTLLDAGAIKVHLDLSRAVPGEQDLMVEKESLPLPEGLALLRLEPPVVRVRLDSRSGPQSEKQ